METLGAAASRLLARLEENAEQRRKNQAAGIKGVAAPIADADQLLDEGSANKGGVGEQSPLLRRHRFTICAAANDNAPAKRYAK